MPKAIVWTKGISTKLGGSVPALLILAAAPVGANFYVLPQIRGDAALGIHPTTENAVLEDLGVVGLRLEGRVEKSNQADGEVRATIHRLSHVANSLLFEWG